MKIYVNRVSSEGLLLEEEIDAKQLDLETELVRFRTPLLIRARVFKITNALTVELNVRSVLFADCCRCLKEFEWEFNKDVKLGFPLTDGENIIDLDPEIREEVILDYPVKPLCSLNCKGLCMKCGKNKNEGGCCCGST